MPPGWEIPWGSFAEDVDLLNFIIEKTENVKSQMLKGELAAEVTTKRGCPERSSFFVGRIAAFCAGLNKMETFDNVTKIKLMFLLSVSCNKRLLQIVRMDAHVEVDHRNRITKYRANDGSVNFEGEYPQSKKKKNRTKGISPESTKRPAEEVPNCQSKRPRIDPWQPETPNHSEPGANYPSPGDYRPFEHFNHAPLESYPLSGSMEILNHPEVQSPQEPEIVEVKPKFTSLLKFLEAIKSLVISLDTPTLSRIQSKIQQKIWKIDQSNSGIPNDEMILVMDLLVARTSNNSVFDLPEFVESVSFKEFLCYLKCVILSLKLEGLEVLLKKIKEKNEEVAMKDKKIPVDKVAVILQYALDFI
ncbi:unnamed protein product [Caenorhabditis brenneri]